MRVLLVDPEGDLLPRLQGPLLGVPGVELYCAPDGPTAIQHAGFLGGVDVLLTEVFLQGLDGFALRDTLNGANPTLRTVFLTRHNLAAHAGQLGTTPVLRLPISPEQLIPLISRPAPLRQDTPPPLPIGPAAAIGKATPARAGLQSPAPLGTPLPGMTDPRTPQSQPAAGVAAQVAVSPRSEALVQHATPISTSLEAPKPPPPPPPPELREGLVLGPYRLLREDEPTRWGPTFTGVHSTLGRPVTLVLLAPKQAAVPEIREEFLAEAGAKASVQHPAVLTVYEACEFEGHLFYTIERVDGLNLLDMAGGRKTLSVEVTLILARTAGEGMQHLRTRGIPHVPLRASAVLLAADGTPRLQNLALGGLRPATSEAEDVATLGRCIETVLGDDAPMALRSLLGRTAPNHQKRVATWTDFLAGISQCEAAWKRFSARTDSESYVEAEEPPRKRSRRSPLVLLAALSGLVAAGAAVYWSRGHAPLVPAQVRVPGGQYLVGSGRRVALEGFSIDRTEVSNRQYGSFLEWQRTHPAEAASFDHPDQPPHHSHTPPYWKDVFPEVERHRTAPDDPRWDLPVTEICWWDAFAFARWAGRDLPTEDEWEAAGRGPRGLLFPWGDEPDSDRSNVKRLPRPGEVPSTVAVEALQDTSAFGVLGLSGNVSEWTSTLKEGQGAVAKGGHFNAPLLTLDAASPLPPDTRSPSLGFRTVSRKHSRF